MVDVYDVYTSLVVKHGGTVPKTNNVEPKTQFGLAAVKTFKHLRAINTFYMHTRSQYRGTDGYLNATTKSAEELQRDRIDAQATTALNKAQSSIDDLRKIAHNGTSAHSSHHNAILDFLKRYTKDTKALFTAQRKRRVDNAKLQHQGYHRLTRRKRTAQSLVPEPEYVSEPPTQLNPVQRQELTEKSASLYHELENLVGAIREVTSLATEVADMQGIISETVQVHGEVIERVATNVTNANAKVKQGNKQLQQADKRGSGLRHWIIGILLFLSVLLLFLDYYS